MSSKTQTPSTRALKDSQKCLNEKCQNKQSSEIVKKIRRKLPDVDSFSDISELRAEEEEEEENAVEQQTAEAAIVGNTATNAAHCSSAAGDTKMSDFERIRLVILGGAGVGKSCIVKRFLFKTYSDKYRATVEDLYNREYDLGGVTLKVCHRIHFNRA